MFSLALIQLNSCFQTVKRELIWASKIQLWAPTATHKSIKLQQCAKTRLLCAQSCRVLRMSVVEFICVGGKAWIPVPVKRNYLSGLCFLLTRLLTGKTPYKQNVPNAQQCHTIPSLRLFWHVINSPVWTSSLHAVLTVCISVDSEFATRTNTSASRQNLSIQLSSSVVTSIPGLEMQTWC